MSYGLATLVLNSVNIHKVINAKLNFYKKNKKISLFAYTSLSAVSLTLNLFLWKRNSEKYKKYDFHWNYLSMIWQRKKITLQYTTKMIINFSRYSYFKIGLSDWFSWHMGGSFFHQLFKLLTLQKILLKTGNLLYDIVTCKIGNRQTLTR